MKNIFIAILVCCSVSLQAQSLLANGGFEDENTCTEYRVKCAPEAWICTAPSFYFYFRGAEVAHTGEFFMGIVAGHAIREYKRTYLRTRLVCGLRKNNQYHISFFIRSPHRILDSVGICFTENDFLLEKRILYKITPSLYLADAVSKLIKSDTGWQKVDINYTATGDENFFTIGYFGKKDLKGSTGVEKENNFLIFVDDFAMVPTDPAELICSNWRSNMDSIYDENDRHELLDKAIRFYRVHPPAVTKFAATELPHIDTLILPDILFATASASLNKNSFSVLDSLCAAINKTGFDSLRIDGHTDSVGTLAYNNKLSAGRAGSVADYIHQRVSAQPSQIIVRFFAYTKPVAPNADAVGRQKNRRVELFLYRHL